MNGHHHDDPLVVGVPSTAGVYYAIRLHCGAHTPLVPEPEGALALLRYGPECARTGSRQPRLFTLHEHADEEESWAGAA